MRYRIFSWNINGLRAVIKKGALQKFLAKYQPEILCLQEIKARPEQLELEFEKMGYRAGWFPAKRSGYAGTAILLKSAKNLSETAEGSSKIVGNSEKSSEKFAKFVGAKFFENFSIAGAEFERQNADLIARLKDSFGDLLAEGRILTLELADCLVVNVYTPNAKPDLARLDLRGRTWDPLFANFLAALKGTKKAVVVCGDFNVAHQPIDLARPKINVGHAGFTNEERAGMARLLQNGWVDSFRVLYPEAKKYTWWTYLGQARQRNVGWRIDYGLVSERKFLRAAEILDEIGGSDHCPIMVEVEV